MMRSILAGAAAAVLLAACGGGGGGADASPVVSPVPAPVPSTYRLPVRTAGDVVSFKLSGGAVSEANLPVGPIVSFYSNETTESAVAGGSVVTSTSSVASGKRKSRDYNATGALQRDGTYPLDHDCQFSPAYFAVPATLTAGQGWDNNAQLTCTASYETLKFDFRTQGSFVAFEPITIAAGTFDAIKLHYTETQTWPAEIIVTDYSEWRDMMSGIVLKSTQLQTITLSSNPTHPMRYSYTSELAGYAHAASGRQKANVERYAGDWSGAYTGGASGTCTMVISATGSMSGKCSVAGTTGMTLAGAINAQGVATFSLQANGVSGPAFSGAFQSPLAVTGQWSSPSAAGTWQMTHN